MNELVSKLLLFSDMASAPSPSPPSSVGQQLASPPLLSYNRCEGRESSPSLSRSVSSTSSFFCLSWRSLWSSREAPPALAQPRWPCSKLWRGPRSTSAGCRTTGSNSTIGSTARRSSLVRTPGRFPAAVITSGVFN